MKIKFFLLITIFVFSNVEAQFTKTDEEKILEFLIKEKVISANSNNRIILFPFTIGDIQKNELKNTDEMYWSIIQKYYPEISKDSLKIIVAKAPCLKKNITSGLPNVIFFEKIVRKKNYVAFDNKTNSEYIYGISNFIYSKDRKNCILYIYYYGYSGIIVEINRDELGIWNSFGIKGEPLN